MATKKGKVKKTAISAFANIRANGIIAIRLKNNDRLIKVVPTSGENQVILISHLGKAIKFSENQVRNMGRATSGMRGMKLKEGDYVVGAETFSPNQEIPQDKRKKVFQDLLVIMEKGIGKRTTIGQFPLQKRAGMGVKVAKITEKTGKIKSALLVNQKIKQIIITSRKAQIIKLPLKNIPRLNRATQGVILMRFTKTGDSVAAVTYLKKEEK